MKDNEFGFDFGSMTVTRTCQDEKASVISISTKKAKFSIRATPNGSLRFYDNQGNELELVNKLYMDNLTIDSQATSLKHHPLKDEIIDAIKKRKVIFS